jgi:pimeloyl-ACP methyl ester carboxylesterase
MVSSCRTWFAAPIRGLTIASAGVAACTASPLAAAPPASVQGSWHKVECPFDARKAFLPVTCGRLTVPENYDEPSGRSIEIAVMIVSPRRQTDSESSVLYLHGGPGGPHLGYAERLVATPAIRDVVVDRDWVFFDQRGGGRSKPALYCPSGIDDPVKRRKTCRDNLIKEGVDLSQYNSARSSSDMEALRKALGVRQWNLWGASYGSRLAFSMARYYPSSVRAIVHDGPQLPEYQVVVSDLQGAEIAFHRLLSKCAADAACSARFPDLRNRFLAALPRLRQEPVTSGKERFDDNRVAQFAQSMLFAAADGFGSRVQKLLVYMDAAARGDAKMMLQIEHWVAAEDKRAARNSPPPPQTVYWHLGQNLSIDCSEEKAFESADEYAQAAARSEIVRSLFGKGYDVFDMCALWPAGRADPIENTRVHYDGPQLVFSGELDPSLSGLAGYTIDMHYPNASNVVFRNAGHVQFYMGSDGRSPEEYAYRRCALDLGRQFLADPQRKLDTRCAETRKLRLVQ